VFGQLQMPRDLAGGIVIAAHDDDARARLAQSVELCHEEETRGIVLPVPVVDVPGDQQEPRVFRQAKIDERFERATRRAADLVYRGARIVLEP